MSQSTALTGVDSLRLEQARRLQQSVVASCLVVEALILTLSPLFFVDGRVLLAMGWISGSSLMVLVVYAYSRMLFPNDIDESNYRFYLRGHIVISCITGTVWSGFAMYQLEAESLLSMYIATMIPITITLGGMFPSSAYRATYIGILTCCVLPVSVYWFFALPIPIAYYAIGFLVYYAFGLLASARTEINMRDLVLANQATSLNEQLMAKNEAIEQSNTERTRFMLATVHDFSQPLHAQGYFIHALRNTLTDHRQLDLLAQIEASWQSQGDLLQGITDISRIDGGLIEPRFATIDIATVLDTIASEFRIDAEHSQVSLATSFSSMYVTTDAALLTRIVRNVVSNAIKNTPPHGKIELSACTRDAEICICVSDTGVGIPTEDQARIFEEYVQLDNNKDRGRGLGLGLSIVQRLSQLLSIELRLESTPGTGTRFELLMPPAIQQEPVDPSADDGAHKRHAAPLVFIVDDEISITEGMKALLSTWGCEVVIANSGPEALDTLAEMEHVPSLLIVDNHLDDTRNGLNVIESLRDEVNHILPAILMTGDINVDGIGEYEDVTLMAKPVDPGMLKQYLFPDRSS